MCSYKLCLYFFLINAAYGADVIIKNLTECGEPTQHLLLDCDAPRKGILQHCDVVYRLMTDDGNHFRFECTLEILQGKRWRKLASLKQNKGVCSSFEIYLKQLLYDFLEAANLPKQCPFKKGTISAKHVGIDVSSLQGIILPKATIRLHIKTYEKTTGRMGLCVIMVLESR